MSGFGVARAGVSKALLLVLLAGLTLASCGKRGPPAPPGPPGEIIWPRTYPTR